MTVNGWLQIAIFAAIVIAITSPMGAALVNVAEGRRNFLTPVLGPVERGIYRARRHRSGARAELDRLRRQHAGLQRGRVRAAVR